MKYSFKHLAALFCLLLALPLSVVVAQTALSQPVDLGDGYTISIPADWWVTPHEAGNFELDSDTLTVSVATPTYLATFNESFTAKSNVVDVLVELLNTVDGVQVARADVQKVRIGDRSAASYTTTGGSGAGQMYIALPLSDGSFGYLTFFGDQGQLSAQQDLVSAIPASFDSGSSSGGSASTTGGGSVPSTGGVAPASNSTTAVACTVSVDKANTAQLRVGPGTNRGVIAFLPANAAVTVTGRIELDNGSVWYQLDKSEAAPKGTAASELWVAATDVTANGNCDQVGSTSAPPVIPLVVAPPTANPGSGSSNPAPSAPGALPRAGAWVLTLNATTNASCLGGQNVPFTSQEIFGDITYYDTITIVSNSVFNYGPDPFTRIPGTNSFSGSYTFADGTNAQLRFDLVSPTTMSGQLVGNFTIDGTPCSSTVLFVTNHR